jgi:hypothetical protein
VTDEAQEELRASVRNIDRGDDHTGACPLPWSSVELIVGPQRSFDTERIVGEWVGANPGWTVSHVSREEVMLRALDSLPSSALQSSAAIASDFAVHLGRFITVAADSRKVSVWSNVPPSDFSPNLGEPNGWILFDERGICPLVIAMTPGSVFCASTIRVAARLIEDGQDAIFAVIIESVASAARVLGAEVPRIMREANQAWSGAHSRGEWARPWGNFRRGVPGTGRRYLTRLALAETAAAIVSSGYP